MADVIDGRVALPEPDVESGPRLTDWSPMVDMLARLSDQVQTLIQINLVGVTGKKAPKVTPTPRPKTALSVAQKRARDAAMRRKFDEIVETFTPGEAGPD